MKKMLRSADFVFGHCISFALPGALGGGKY
jgi:hypothetical protein